LPTRCLVQSSVLFVLIGLLFCNLCFDSDWCFILYSLF
jgi:hypothetical protein